MNFPIILQDINNNILQKEIVVTTPTFFIKSYRKFTIEIQDNYEIDFISNSVDKVEDSNVIFDIPQIYSVKDNTNIVKTRKVEYLDANYSYTLFLGKTEKTINYIIWYDEENYSENSFILTIKYKPNNVILSNQQHYESLLINNDLPTIDKLLPAIIKKETEYDLIRKLLLDFKEIKKHRGKLKSIENFLKFIGFDPDSIKLYPEYNTPNNTKTIQPNKLVDIKNGYYHVLYDNWIVNENDKYTNKNLPKRLLQVNDISELFDKLIYALTLANDYFTVPEQEMSFFGVSNSANSEQYLSITSNTTKVYHINTLDNLKNININIFNRTLLDSYPLYIVKNKFQKNINVKLSEVKVYLGSNIKYNDYLFLIDKELSDNSNDTDLTDEQELTIEYLFGNILHIELSNTQLDSNKYLKCQYVIKNLNNEFIQFKSDVYEISTNLIQHKLFVGLFGTYEIKFKFWDYFGNQEEYKYTIKITETNLNFNIFNSTQIIDKNNISQDVDSTIETENFIDSPKNNLNFELENSASNALLDNDLKNYFDIILSEKHKNLFGYKQFSMKLMNKNIQMKNITQTLWTKYVDNFLNIISIKKVDNNLYSFSDDLFVKLMDIKLSDDTIEQHYFISPKTNSTHISKYLYDINIINNLTGEKYDTNSILKNELPSIYEYKNKIIPVNYDFELYQELDYSNTDLPSNSLEPINIKSVYPRLRNIDIDDILVDDDTYSLKIGDIILCTIDNRFITKATDIKWQIFNAFTDELLYEYFGFSLKYRVMESALYNIKLTLFINGEQYVVQKKEIQTSFNV